MFSDELQNISWEETTEKIASKTDTDVRRALAKQHCDVDDFMALLSPAAEPYLCRLGCGLWFHYTYIQAPHSYDYALESGQNAYVVGPQ